MTLLLASDSPHQVTVYASMLGLLPMITFALWWTFVVAVILPKDFNEMPEELKDAFKEFVRRNQPLKITRDTELNILPRGSVLWPEEGIEVFIGKKFNKNPDLEDFRGYRDWGNLYMDERTHTFLKRIEYQLSAVIPTFDDKRWFRSALSDSFHPRRRGDSSPADVLDTSSTTCSKERISTAAREEKRSETISG